MVVRRCHFHQVRSHDVDTCQAFHNFPRLAGGKSTTDGGTGTRSIGGIQAVDVKSQVGFVVSNDLANLFDCGIRPVTLYPWAIEDIETQGVLVVGPQADLNRCRRIEESLLCRMPEHGAVIDTIIMFIRPGVTVRIEVNQ